MNHRSSNCLSLKMSLKNFLLFKIWSSYHDIMTPAEVKFFNYRYVDILEIEASREFSVCFLQDYLIPRFLVVNRKFGRLFGKKAIRFWLDLMIKWRRCQKLKNRPNLKHHWSQRQRPISSQRRWQWLLRQGESLDLLSDEFLSLKVQYRWF